MSILNGVAFTKLNAIRDDYPSPKVILIIVNACFVFIIDKVADKLVFFGLILSIILCFFILVNFLGVSFKEDYYIWLFWIDMFYVYQRCLECVSIYLMTARVHHHHFNWSLIGGNKNSISDMEPKYRQVYWSEASFATNIICLRYYWQLKALN